MDPDVQRLIRHFDAAVPVPARRRAVLDRKPQRRPRHHPLRARPSPHRRAGARLPGYAAVTPDALQRRFLETPGKIINNTDTITVRLDRRAYSPVLRQADLPNDTPVPWWGNRTLRYEFT